MCILLILQLLSSNIIAKATTISYTAISHLHIAMYILVFVVIIMATAVVFLLLKIKRIKKSQGSQAKIDTGLLHLLIDNMPDFIYIKDTESKFIIANKYLADIVRVANPKDLIGKSDFDYYPKDMAQKFFDDEQDIIKKKVPLINQEEFGLDANNNPIVVSTTKVPWIDEYGNVKGIIGIGRNITKLKEAQKEIIAQSINLQEVNALLEERHEHIQQQAEELTMQAGSLKDLNNELQKSNDTKDKFISIIAHDLKNPFNAIINFSELLIMKFADTMQPKQLEMLRIINSSSISAYSLLENMLFWAKAQSSAIPCRPVVLNIGDQISEVIDFLEVSAKLKNIVVINEASTSLNVYADTNMVAAILRNLVTNAIKFTNKNGEIRISTTIDAKNAYISIADSGIGMNGEQIRKLFSKDKEIMKGTSGESGTGLGLILCIEFARQNGGNITVKSEVVHGSTFILSLPLPATL